jgi:hypothetical protein
VCVRASHVAVFACPSLAGVFTSMHQVSYELCPGESLTSILGAARCSCRRFRSLETGAAAAPAVGAAPRPYTFCPLLSSTQAQALGSHQWRGRPGRPLIIRGVVLRCPAAVLWARRRPHGRIIIIGSTRDNAAAEPRQAALPAGNEAVGGFGLPLCRGPGARAHPHTHTLTYPNNTHTSLPAGAGRVPAVHRRGCSMHACHASP